MASVCTATASVTLGCPSKLRKESGYLSREKVCLTPSPCGGYVMGLQLGSRESAPKYYSIPGLCGPPLLNGHVQVDYDREQRFLLDPDINLVSPVFFPGSPVFLSRDVKSGYSRFS